MATTPENNSAKVSFETALEKAGFGLYSYSLSGMVGLSIISFGCIAYGSTITAPTSSCELGTTPTQRSIIIASPLIATIIGAVLWGALGDTRGRRAMLAWSILLGAAVNAVASVSVHWSMLMLLTFLASFAASGQYTLSMTLLSECVPAGKRNSVLLLVTSIFMLSQGIMAVLAMPIIPLTFSFYVPGLGIYWNSWRTMVLVYCIPSLLSFVWIQFMEESPKYLFSKGDEEGAINVLRVIYSINHRKSRETLQITGILEDTTPPALSLKEQMGPLFRKPLVKFLAIMTTLSIFLQVGPFLALLPTIANHFVGAMRVGGNADQNLCAVINSGDHNKDENVVMDNCGLDVTALLVVFGTGALQSLVNGSLSLVVNRTGRRNLALSVVLVCGVSGFLVNLVPNAAASASFFVVFLLAFMLVGMYTAITISLFPTHLRAVAVALTMVGGRMTSFGAIPLLENLLRNNCDLGFYLFSTILASSSILLWFLPNDRLSRTASNTSREIEKGNQDPVVDC